MLSPDAVFGFGLVVFVVGLALLIASVGGWVPIAAMCLGAGICWRADQGW